LKDDFQKLQLIITIIYFPLSESDNIKNISTQICNLFDTDSIKLESEIIKIKSDIFLKARGSENIFRNLLSEKKIFLFEKSIVMLLFKHILDLPT